MTWHLVLQISALVVVVTVCVGAVGDSWIREWRKHR